MPEQLPAFAERRLCVLTAGNKSSAHPDELYCERRRVIEFFESLGTGELDLYGRGWNANKYSSYKGWAPSKAELYKNYKFCICYENITNIEGYVTEKIFDCFFYGCVPVYLGASNITDYVPAECFIDRRKFSSNEELYTFLKNMDEETFSNYLAHIRTFLKSPEAQLFSIQNFINIFLDNALEGNHA